MNQEALPKWKVTKFCSRALGFANWKQALGTGWANASFAGSLGSTKDDRDANLPEVLYWIQGWFWRRTQFERSSGEAWTDEEIKSRVGLGHMKDLDSDKLWKLNLKTSHCPFVPVFWLWAPRLIDSWDFRAGHWEWSSSWLTDGS